MAIERKFITEAVKTAKVNKFLHEQLKTVGCGDIEIKRTPLGTRIIVNAQKPGLVIGKKGKNIQFLTEELKNTYKVDNPQIEVVEIENYSLDPNIMANQLAGSLERGFHFRRSSYSLIKQVMNAGALGIEIVISGKISGSRSRSEKFLKGYIKHCGDTADKYVKRATAEVTLKAGRIGIQIKIVPPLDKNLLDQLGISEEQAEAAGDMPTEVETEVKETKPEQKEEKKKATKKKPVKKKAAKKEEKKEEKEAPKEETQAPKSAGPSESKIHSESESKPKDEEKK